MELFDDLMGITHHTDDAWLDKKLNENTAYIGFLGTMALGAVGSKLMGGDRAPQAYGGGFDPEIRPFMREGLKDLRMAYQRPDYFQGPRVAGFDPAQLEAQTSLLALSTAEPDYFRRAETGLEEAIGLQRQAAAPITAEAIQAQREALAPVAEAERMASRRALQEQLRDVGVGAVGAGVGAVEGGRADVLRGTAFGEFAQTEAGIQSRLTEQAVDQLRADRAAQAAGAAGLSTLFGEQLGVAKGQTASDIARAQLAEGVGAERRDLSQARIGEQREIFEERDPFARAQRYLATVQGVPTQKTQYYQPRSTLQEAAGLATLFSGGDKFSSFFENGGQIEDGETAYRQVGSTISPTDAMRAGLQGQVSTGINRPTKEEARRQALERLKAQEEKATQTEDMDSPPAGLGAILDSRGQPVTIAGQGDKDKDSIMSRILGGVRSGLESISSANLDPFKGYTPQERVRIGLGILGAQPEIGEGPLGPIGRGALLAIEDLPEAETVTPRISPVPAGEFDVIDEGILGLQKSRTKAEADQRNQLRIQAEREAIQGIYDGNIANDQASYRNAVKEIYTNKMNKFLTAGSSGSGATGVSSVRTAPAGKGSTSSGIAAVTKPTI